MRGGAFLNGKEGRVGFRKKSFLAGETEGFEKIPSLMGKRDASECSESSLSKMPSAARFISKEGRDDLHAKSF